MSTPLHFTCRPISSLPSLRRKRKCNPLLPKAYTLDFFCVAIPHVRNSGDMYPFASSNTQSPLPVFSVLARQKKFIKASWRTKGELLSNVLIDLLGPILGSSWLFYAFSCVSLVWGFIIHQRFWPLRHRFLVWSQFVCTNRKPNHL